MSPVPATMGRNLLFVRGFSGNSFASLINRARAPPSSQLRRTSRRRPPHEHSSMSFHDRSCDRARLLGEMARRHRL